MMLERDAALAAAGGELREAAHWPATFSVSSDSRSVASGEVFVALRGVSFDGHAFVAQALERGASAVVVDTAGALPPGTPALIVADTTLALLAFARVAREASHARVAAITGSAGKTTTKALLAQLLERTGGGRVAATLANENNEFGVAKLFLGLDPRTDSVVVELGARHFGEIEQLSRVALPDVAILTNIGEAHLEIMGSRERLAETKWGIFATGALPVLNLDDATSRERAAVFGERVEWFGVRERAQAETLPPGVRYTTLVGRELLVVRDGNGTRTFPIECSLPGNHNLANLAAAAAGALALGIAPERVAAAIAGLELPSGRYERVALGELTLIYDAYNASPSGTQATLASFARERAGRRIAVLGSMAELGATAPAMHEDVGAAAARAGLALLLVGGEFAAELERGARSAGFPAEHVRRFAGNAEAIALLRELAQPGDLILLKGSRKYKLEEIREGLRAEYA